MVKPRDELDNFNVDLRAIKKLGETGTFGNDTPMLRDRRPAQLMVEVNNERAITQNMTTRPPHGNLANADDLNMIALNSSSEETFGYTPGTRHKNKK